MNRAILLILAAAVFATACNYDGSPLDENPGPVSNAAAGGETLAEQYPGDIGIGDDPDVIWHESFEQELVSEFATRYDQVRSNGMTFWSERPAGSTGQQSLRMEAGGSVGSATDAYTRLPGNGYEQLYLRYYVRHEDVPYHHTGVCIGGYNPPLAWPNPQAGSRPNGDDRISVTIEPMGQIPGGLRLDFYNYWMRMRSWTEPPSTYYGNAKVNHTNVLAPVNAWICVEIMVRLNDDPESPSGGELALWIDDQLIYHYSQEQPHGYHVRDKFCPADADFAACANYAPPPEERDEILDLQWRNSLSLRLNYLWIQNYISAGSGAVSFDDLVLATRRVGRIVPLSEPTPRGARKTSPEMQ